MILIVSYYKIGINLYLQDIDIPLLHDGYTFYDITLVISLQVQSPTVFDPEKVFTEVA